MTNSNVSILVVDDEPPIRKLLRVGLGSQGYAVSEAPNAARNGRKCTPAGSINRVRANFSHTKKAIAATSAPMSRGGP